MDIWDSARISQPTEWFVVFHPRSTSRFLSFIAFGRFKHVSAFGYCPGFRVWIFYDVGWRGTAVNLIEHSDEGQRQLIELTRDCAIIKVAHAGQTPRFSSRLAFYCVNSIKHLLGLRCVAITPTQFYRFLCQNGGMLISDCRPATAPAA